MRFAVTLGNESHFGWCDVMMSSAGDGPRAEFCDHFGCVVRLTRSSRRYENHMHAYRCLQSDYQARARSRTRLGPLEFARPYRSRPTAASIRWLARRPLGAERNASAYCDTLELRKITARGSRGILSSRRGDIAATQRCIRTEFGAGQVTFPNSQ